MVEHRFTSLDALDRSANDLPAAHVSAETAPRLLLARAGADHPALDRAPRTFVDRALGGGIRLDVASHPTGRHGFDAFDDDARSRDIIAGTLDSLARGFG